MTVGKEFVAILFTDSPMEMNVEHKNKYGDYGDQLMQLLRENPYSKSPLVNYKKYFVKDKLELPEEEELLHCRGILVTGSREDSFDNPDEWLAKLEKFLEKVLIKQEIPIVGICFGHQVIAKVLHAYYGTDNSKVNQVGRNSKGWELGLCNIKTSREFSEYCEKILNSSSIVSTSAEPSKAVRSSFSTADYSSLCLLESHQDIVYSTPPNLLSIGSTDKCAVQGLFNKTSVLTFQGHPEFDTPFLEDVLFKGKLERGAMTKQVYDDLLKNNAEIGVNDGSIVGKLINGFFERFYQ